MQSHLFKNYVHKVNVFKMTNYLILLTHFFQIKNNLIFKNQIDLKVAEKSHLIDQKFFQ